jgi:hypothetical protein
VVPLGGDAYPHKPPKRQPSSLCISPTASISTSSSASSKKNATTIDAEFHAGIPHITQRWRSAGVTKDDNAFINKYLISVEEYMALTDEYNIGSGMELVANKLVFHELPTNVHEHVSLKFNNAILRTYGDDDLVPNGSASLFP